MWPSFDLERITTHYAMNSMKCQLYSTHDITPHGTVDNQVWVSRRRGLILRQETDIDTGNGNKTHMSVRYDYSNVHAPAL